MNEEDKELEILKAKRLAEMQKNISSQEKQKESEQKSDTTKEQMVFAEATSVLPLIASDAYHRENWKTRERRNFQKLF